MSLLEFIRTGSHRRLRELIDAGADVNTVESNWTPLSFASFLGFDKCAIALIDALADVNKEEGGGIPLVYASMQGHWSVVTLLLENGANVNALNGQGDSALH